ncbi:MAG TPA: GNAT family N-acetyltransferase [Chitinophagaceae bacterium]|nr:GNAT family N-acetyltransferase [Chitinophagaceae bacterium]
MRIDIIKATVNHAPAIVYTGRAAFREAFTHLFNNKQELEEYLYYTYGVDKIAHSINKENNVYFLAMVNGSPAGFVKIKKHSLNDQLDSISQAELQKLYVLKKYHGAGVGQALMNAVNRLMETIGPEFLWLDTYVSNERAIRFYERNGFKKSGRHHFTIGSQTFEYFIMTMQVAVTQNC